MILFFSSWINYAVRSNSLSMIISKETTNMDLIKCINVLFVVTIIVMVLVENSVTDGKYDNILNVG